MSAFPPQRSVASIPVAQDIALKYLSAYLEAAKTSSHLLPNARLEPSGPTAGSSTSNITIHNLQRVEAGLRGEWLAPTLDLEEGNVPIAAGMDDGTNKEQENAEAEAEGWMDLDQYQREQSIEGGELGERVPSAVQDVELDSDLEMEDHASGVYGDKVAPAKKPLDKAARKAEKKRREKEEKQKKEAARKAGHLAR